MKRALLLALGLAGCASTAPAGLKPVNGPEAPLESRNGQDRYRQGGPFDVQPVNQRQTFDVDAGAPPMPMHQGNGPTPMSEDPMPGSIPGHNL